MGVVRTTCACPLCGAREVLGGYSWAADPWSHLLVECDAAHALVSEHTDVGWAVQLCRRTSVAAALYIAAGATVTAFSCLLGHLSARTPASPPPSTPSTLPTVTSSDCTTPEGAASPWAEGTTPVAIA